jgi:dTDP-4-amino-4,6-dideoxygalactose transaminase
MTVPFLNLKRQYSSIKNEIVPAVVDVLESGQFVLGPQVESFEQDFARYCGVKYAVAVNSGTSALHLALLAAGVGPGDEVITVPCTFVATTAAILYSGAKPIFVDVDPITYTMDSTLIERAITKKTKAILPVHLFGNPADMASILNIAERHHLVVIEDAAQAHSAEYRGVRCGAIGQMGCFSFYPGKNLGAYGEGGLVTTNNPEYARTIRMLRDWGAERKYEHVLKGFNYRMEAVQGAILRIKLRHLDRWTDARRAHAARYDKALADSGLTLPTPQRGSKHVYHIYPVLTQDRPSMISWLNSFGVQTGIHYPHPVHLLPAYEDLGYRRGDFPVRERIALQELSLPMFPEMSESELSCVVDGVMQFASRSFEAVSSRV